MEQLGGGVRKGVDWVYLELDRIRRVVHVNTVVRGWELLAYLNNCQVLQSPY